MGELLAFFASVALARLVAPVEFGWAAVALIIPTLAVVLSFQGFGAVLVQQDELEPSSVRTAGFLSLLAGVLLSVAFFLSAPFWAEPLFGPRTSGLIQLASPAFALAALGVVPRALLQRRLDFRRLGLYEVVAFTVGSIAAVACAVGGLEGESLVIGMLAMTAIEALLMTRAAPPPTPWPSGHRMGSLVSFGLPASLAGIANVARRNADYVVLSATLPAAQVGFYWRAFQLGAEYQGKLSGVMLRLVFPLYSRAREAERVWLRRRIMRTNVLVTFPFLALLIVLAPTMVPWLYGARWAPAVEPTQVLALGGAALAVRSGTDSLLLAAGHPRVLLGFNLAFLTGSAGAAVLASPSGLLAVCIAVTSVYLVMVAFAQLILLDRFIGVRPRETIADIGPALIAASAAIGVGFLLSGPLGGLSAVPEMVVLSTGCLLTYVLVLRLVFPSCLRELIRTVGLVLSRRSSSGRNVRLDPAAPAAGGA